jgi:GT2 family glycosyltransferase
VIHPTVPSDRVYVVLVNWRTAPHTVECLESLLRSDYPDFQVVVCDNASGDGSLERLAAWATGDEAFAPPAASPVRLNPPVSKPVPAARLARAEAERGGTAACDHARVVLVDTEANLGFAGGCNVGIAYALARGDAGYVWLLNNDTVVDGRAMRALVERLRQRPDAGQCGSTLYFYHEPSRVQALAGKGFDPRTGIGSSLSVGAPPRTPDDTRAIEAAIGYIEGASIMVPRRFLDEVGPLSEAYFLYFEELDWVARSRGRFTLAYAPDSIVYHKEGASAGSSADAERRTLQSERYLVRNRLRFTWRHNRRYLLPVVLTTLRVALRRLRDRRYAEAKLYLGAVVSPRTYVGFGR